jgi:hypothetical protein
VAGGGTLGLGDGGPATSATFTPVSVSPDSEGNLLIADPGNSRVRVVAESTGTFYGQAMTAGDIYTVAGDNNSGFSGDGGPATSAGIGPQDVTTDAAGNLVIADTNNERIRVVAESTGTLYGQAMTAGDIYTVAGTGSRRFSGDGGPATSAALNGPTGVTLDGAGNLVIADTANGRVRVVAERTGTFYGQAMTAGHIYTIAGRHAGSAGVLKGVPAGHVQLADPVDAVADGAGNQVIADALDNQVQVVAASSGTFYGQAMTAGDVYTVAGSGTSGFNGDGGPATSAQLQAPGGIAVDGTGNLVIADTNNDRVRVVAAQTGTFYGQAMTAGHIYTIAGTGQVSIAGDGGPATQAGVDAPQGISVDAATGNVLIASAAASEVQVVAETSGTFYGRAMTAGDIYRIAGANGPGFSGDGGPATLAQLRNETGLTVDAAGNAVIADTGNNRIRVVAETSGTFYGRAMTAGDIFTVIGTGKPGFSGDGGPASGAELRLPVEVTATAAGGLLITDTGNNRVRLVSG